MSHSETQPEQFLHHQKDGHQDSLVHLQQEKEAKEIRSSLGVHKEHEDEVRQRKELWNRLDESDRHRWSHESLLRQEAAEAQRMDHVQSIKEKQDHEHEHEKEVRQRKELWDRLDESDRHRWSHESILRQETAQAQRMDHVQSIKEKQAHLQGH
jgi:hypothetical protein